jgi:hypothetical protein
MEIDMEKHHLCGFIKLKSTYNDQPVYIRASHVDGVAAGDKEDKGKTGIRTSHGEIGVFETPEEIFDQIENFIAPYLR